MTEVPDSKIVRWLLFDITPNKMDLIMDRFNVPRGHWLPWVLELKRDSKEFKLIKQSYIKMQPQEIEK